MKILIAAAALALLCPSAPAAETTATGKSELKIVLPKPLFVGTPKNIRSANLEPVTGKAREPFLVAPDTQLLSKGKAVTSSDREPVTGDLTLVTDGDKEGVDGSYVELGPGKQWVQVDLGAAFAVEAVVVWHFHSQARVYQDVVVQLADDPDFIENVRTVFNNDHDNSSGLGAGKDKEWIETYEGRLIPAGGQAARYVRLYSNGSTASPMNHYIEVEVYGKPAKR